MSVSQSGHNTERVNTLTPGSGRALVRQGVLATVKRKSPLTARNGEKRREPDVYAYAEDRREHLQPEELMAFFKNIPQKTLWQSYFFVQYFFGCRVSEPALIMDEDVSFKKKLIVIRRLKNAQHKQGYRQQVFEAEPRVLAAVTAAQRCKERRGFAENPFLFASNRKRGSDDVGVERLSQLRNLDGWQAVSRFTAHRMFKQISTEARLPERLRLPHVLRHTRVLVMLAGGATPEEVTKMLGYKSGKTPRLYVEAAERMRGKISDAFIEMGLGL